MALFRKKKVVEKSKPTITIPDLPIQQTRFGTEPVERGIIKRYIPYFLYKPPFGYPRTDIDIINVRKLAQTPFVYSVINTLLDEVCSAKWKIVPYDDTIKEEQVKDKIKRVTNFLDNPNDNDESLRSIIRAVTKDVLEIDAGVINKVYNRRKEITQLVTADGATFLFNPDIHGSISDRSDYIDPMPYDMNGNNSTEYYTNYLKEEAAYFQYNWTGGVSPIPFGKKEIIYIKKNNRTDSIYGLSPIMVLYNTLLTLLYGSKANLDMYINSNLPTGIVSLLNANQSQIDALRVQFNSLILHKDEFNNNVKNYYQVPITNADVKYVPFQFDAKALQMLEQQQWYQKLVWACFSTTAEEMGETGDSNRSVASEMSRVFKRKALKPIFSLLEYHLNSQLIWELDPEKEIKFIFDDYDVESDFRKNELYEKKLSYMSINEIRKLEGLKPLEGDEYNSVRGITNYTSMSGNFTSSTDSNTKQEYNPDEYKQPDEKKEIQEYEHTEPNRITDVPNKKSILDFGDSNFEKKLIAFYDDLQKKLINSVRTAK